MLIPVLSLVGLLAAIAIGYFRRLNIGLVAIAAAFVIGHFLAGMPAAGIVSGWPLRLFFMLLGMTLLFGIAAANGTLRVIARHVIGLTGGRTRLVPPVFFLLAGVLSAMGPGNISVCALLLPIAMATASLYGVSPLLMATMVIAGANAGGLSPIAPTGIIGVTLSQEQGLDIGWRVFYKQIVGQSVFAALLYVLLRGHRLSRLGPSRRAAAEPLRTTHFVTLGVLLLVVAAIVVGRWDLGLTAFSGTVALLLLGAADEREVVRQAPWSTLILVCGMGMLVNVSDQVGGIDLLTRILSRLMNARTAGPIMAVIGGLLSIVSSASGVVMPTLIPTVPGLASDVGGDPASLVAAIIMGAHVVTNSPISTLGALAIASAGPHVDRNRLFRDMLLVATGGLGYAAAIVFLGLV